MRRVAHLSDLHFGRVDDAVLDPLRRRVRSLAPDLVVVSGDLTQRARAGEFREARAFLDTLPHPQLVVPGNHDVPLYNVFARFFRPLAGYRRAISSDPEPAYLDEEIAVLGVNSARSFAFKGGRVSAAQLERVQALCRARVDAVKIVVTHHPFGAPERLGECGVDLVVAGHLHTSRVGHADERVLMVQAGTATSRRTRAEPNAFNLIKVWPRRVEVDHYVLKRGGFARATTEAFQRKDRHSAWRRSGAA